jgi:hypothetical protein
MDECDILPAEVLPHYIVTRPFSQAKSEVGGAKGAGETKSGPRSLPLSTRRSLVTPPGVRWPVS